MSREDIENVASSAESQTGSERLSNITGDSPLRRLETAFQKALANSDGDVDLIEVLARAILLPEFSDPQVCQQMFNRLAALYVTYQLQKQLEHQALVS